MKSISKRVVNARVVKFGRPRETRMASLAVQLQYLIFPCVIGCYRSPLRSYNKNTTRKILTLVVFLL